MSEDDPLLGVREEALAISDKISPKGRSVIHQSENFRDIVDILAMVCLDGNGKIPWSELSASIEKDFGVKASAAQIKDFCTRYIYPHIYMPRSHIMKGIIESRRNLNTVERQLAIGDASFEALMHARKTMGLVIKDESGRPHKVGPTASEVAALTKAAIQANEASEDALERWGFIPARQTPRKGEGGGVDVNVNVNTSKSAMGRLFGNPKVVDAEPIDVDDED